MHFFKIHTIVFLSLFGNAISNPESQLAPLTSVDKFFPTRNYSVLSLFSNGTTLTQLMTNKSNKPSNSTFVIPFLKFQNVTSTTAKPIIDKPKPTPSNKNFLKPEEMVGQEDYDNVIRPMSPVISSMNPETVHLQSTTDENEIFTEALPLPSKNLENPVDDDIEETFTYQVKRQKNKKFMATSTAEQDFLKTASILQNSVGWRRYKENFGNILENKNTNAAVVDDAKTIKKKLDQLEQRMGIINVQINTFLDRISELASNASRVDSRMNATITALTGKVTQINENYRINENETREIRRSITGDKTRVEGQIQTLSMHLRNLNYTTNEKIQQAVKVLENLTSSVHNVSHDARMNDMRTRYNLKAISSIDKLVQTNNEKISEVSSAVGARWVEQTTGCGGVLIGDSGILSYKFRQPYRNDERCIWTIRVNRKPRIVLQLLEDGFQNASNSDFITITEFTDDQPPVLVTSSRIEHGNRAIHTFRGPLIFVSFFTDASTTGNGFTLKFQGTGTTNSSQSADSLNAIRYSHLHLKDSVSHLIYPTEKDSFYQPNEIATFAINPPGNSLRLHLRYTDLEKEESCEYDSVNFYASNKASYALSQKYCDHKTGWTGESLQSSDGTFIIVFRSDGSTQFSGFQFSWEAL